MKNKYTIAGILLSLLGIGFIAFALTNPQLSFPWPNWVSYTFYAFYVIYTILIFCMPKMKNADFGTCVILAVEFIALGFIVLSIGLRHNSGEGNWYLPAGLLLTSFASFANLYRTNKKKQ